MDGGWVRCGGETGGYQGGVDRSRDEGLQVGWGWDGEGLHQGFVGQGPEGSGEGEEGEEAEFDGLFVVERGEVGSCWKPIQVSYLKGVIYVVSILVRSQLTLILLPRPPGKNLKQFQVSFIFIWRVWRPEALDRRRLQQLRKDIGMRIRRGIRDDIRDEAGRRRVRRVGQVHERLERLEGARVCLVHYRVLN